MNYQRISTILVLVISTTYAADLYPYGPSNGDSEVTEANDGYKEIKLSQGLPFYGYLFKKAFINENGLVSMITPVNDSNWRKNFPIDGNADNNGDSKLDPTGTDARVIMAPFWANIDVTEGGNIYYRQVSTDNDTDDVLSTMSANVQSCFIAEYDFTATTGVVITWDDVSFFGRAGSPNPLNRFQLVLASDSRESFAFFLYDKIEWNAGTDSKSQGDATYGRGSRGAVIGFNVGDGFRSLTHSYSGKEFDTQVQLTQYNNCPALGDNADGSYAYKIDGTDIEESGCKNDALLTVFPSVGSMFGGEIIYLAGPCWDSSVEIMCRFKYNDVVIQEVTGERLDGEKAACIPKPFFISSELTIEVSKDGGETYVLSDTYYVANLDHISSSGVVRRNPTWENWDKEGMDLTLTWEPTEFDDSIKNISIAALIYREDGSKGPSWHDIFEIGTELENSGTYTFQGEAVSQVFEDNAFGAIRIMESDNEDGRTLWSDVHMLGYLLNSEYQESPEAWSTEQCGAWAEEDRKKGSFVSDLTPCPCTLEQAIVDTGRFQPDYHCSMYDGSKCLHHVGAKHCVISVTATEITKSASSCCYSQAGDLMYAGDSREGSTSARSHVWGAEPYRKPGKVPGLSHWLNDVSPFHYCCKWGEDCDTFLDLRPTPDCKEYTPPKSSATFGDPHFVTFDGVEYTFNGKGEFVMVEEEGSGFELQVRTEQASYNATADVSATVLTAIAMGEPNVDNIHVELSEITVLKFVRTFAGTSEVVDFYGQEWLDFNGVSVIVLESENGNVHKATLTYWESGIGVNVTANGQTLAVAATLPPSLKKNTKVKGLLGNWDDNQSNDLIDRTGNKLDPNNATPQEILAFGITWEIEDSLFYYEVGNHKEFQDNDFVPDFEAPDSSTLPSDLVNEMNQVCGSSKECVFDVSVTQDISVGEYTKAAQEAHERVSEYTEAVVACPYLAAPFNGTKSYKDNQKNNLKGAVVQFACNADLKLQGPEERTCQSSGKWTGDGETSCVNTGCPPVEDPDNGEVNLVYEDGEYVEESTCDDGYNKEGSSTRSCVNGKWKGQKASCHSGLTPSKKTNIIVGVVIAIIFIVVIAIALCVLIRTFNTPEETGKNDTALNTVKRPPTSIEKTTIATSVNETMSGDVNMAMELDAEDEAVAAADEPENKAAMEKSVDEDVDDDMNNPEYHEIELIDPEEQDKEEADDEDGRKNSRNGK